MDDTQPTVRSQASPWPRLFAPTSVALVGASDRNEYWAQLVVNARKLGYAGDLVAVNPRRPRLGGNAAAGRLSEVDGVDCAIVNVPASAVNDVVADGLRSGVRAFVVYSSGFRDAGEAGAQLEHPLTEMCRASGAVLIGPNCMGMMSVVGRAPLYGAEISASIRPGTVGLISQSGSAVVSLLNNERGVDFSHVVSTGNEAVSTAEDVMEYMIDEGRSTVIALVVETLRQPDRFRSLARRAYDRGIPVVALKLGNSARGYAVTFGHTGAVAGSAEVYRAAFAAEHVIQVDDYDEQLETLVALTHGRRPPGRRVAVIGFSGGHMSLAADVCAGVGLELATLSPVAVAELREALSLQADRAIENPLDIGVGFAAKLPLRPRYAECIRALKRDPSVDAVVVVQDLQQCLPDSLFPDYLDIMDGVADADDTPGALAVLTPTAGLFKPALVDRARHLTDTPLLQGMRPGLRALRLVGDWEAARSAHAVAETADSRRPDSARWTAAKRAALGSSDAEPRTVLSEVESKAILRAYGVNVSTDVLTLSADAAATAATKMGYPVVCKIVSADVLHKWSAGGVRLGLRSEDAVRTAFREVTAAVETTMGARIDGVLVSREMPAFAELIVGVKRDEAFGPVMVMGIGGVHVEVLQMTSTTMVPTSRERAREIVAEFPGVELLSPQNGRPPVETGPMVDLIMAVEALTADAGDDLAELDLNPVVVAADGVCTVVDAAIVLRARLAEGD